MFLLVVLTVFNIMLLVFLIGGMIMILNKQSRLNRRIKENLRIMHRLSSSASLGSSKMKRTAPHRRRMYKRPKRSRDTPSSTSSTSDEE